MPELLYDHAEGVILLQPNAESKMNNLAGEKRLFSSLGYGNEADS